MADNYGQWFITKMFTDAEAAAVTSGKQITFKKMIASQDIFTQDDLATLTNSVLGTIDIKQQVNISTVLPSTGSYKVQGVFSNSTVTADYLMNTILLVGSYNGTEFLAAAQVANNAFKMPAASTGEQTIYNIAAQISVSNTATVSLTVDPDSIVTNAGLKVVTDAQVVKDSAQDVKISSLETKDAQNVKTTGNQTIAGIKTFTEKIIGSITGTAEKAVALVTSRKLKVKLDSTTDKTFNGTADVTDIGVSGVLPIANGGTGNTTGSAKDLVTSYIPANSDLDTYLTAGWYRNASATGITNMPPEMDGTWFFLEVMNVNSANVIQRYYGISSGRWFTRRYYSTPAVWGAWIQLSDDSTVVHNTGDETIAGVKSFTQKVNASISGNAGTATKLETSRKIDGKDFDGTKDIVLDVVHNHGDENIAGIKTFTEKIIGSITGTADKAVALFTGRKLKVKLDSTTDKTFNGTADVTDIGVSGVLQIANGGTGVSDGTVNTTAWAYSADGVDRFTTVYPNLNLLDGTKDFSGTWTNSSSWVTDGTYKGLTVKKRTTQWNGIYKTFTAPKDGTYTFSSYVKSSGDTANVYRYGGINGKDKGELTKFIGNNFYWTRDSITFNLKANDSINIRYEILGGGTDSILWTAGHKWENSSTSTPYMPSTSEVTTADWPSYIGYSNTLKLGKGPTDFTWTQVFTEKSVVPITNGGTGNANGLAVGQSSGAQLRSFDDLNDIATTIQYTLNGETPINAPTDAKSNFGFVIVQTRDDSGSGFAVQRYITTANEEFIRSKIGDPHYYWTDWKQL
ncbi:pyocin knob domain-containing protein [Lactococcus lactis]|uniref:pyocin knob domain-containing protein n=1 Tax=Lactococcus lactis TaxID=1358 RepID=UPI00288D08AE|nr:pyocin knob domain-containing protein [Lactococcus lactis]MDT2889431.1 pyocin knob domain-containing protein [Lactococcus lactis]